MNELLPLVTNIPALQALNTYLDSRILALKGEFMSITTTDELKSLQRGIRELEQLKYLREKVIAEGNK